MTVYEFALRTHRNVDAVRAQIRNGNLPAKKISMGKIHYFEIDEKLVAQWDKWRIKKRKAKPAKKRQQESKPVVVKAAPKHIRTDKLSVTMHNLSNYLDAHPEIHIAKHDYGKAMVLGILEEQEK